MKFRMVALALFLSACQSDPSVPNDTVGQPPQDGFPTTREVCPKGGLFEFGPVTLEVAEGTFDECVSVVVEEATDLPVGNIHKGWQVFADGAQPASPMTLTIRLNESDLPAPFAYHGLHLAMRGKVTWQPFDDSLADAEAQTVSAAIHEFGVFGIIPTVRIDLLVVLEKGAGTFTARTVLAARLGEVLDQVAQRFPLLDVHVAATDNSRLDSPGFSQPHPSFAEVPYPYLNGGPHTCLDDDDCIDAYGPDWECGPHTDGLFCGMGICRYVSCQSDSDCCKAYCTDNAACDDEADCPFGFCLLADAEVCPLACEGSPAAGDGTCQLRELQVACPEFDDVLTYTNADASLAQRLPCILQLPPVAASSPIPESLFLAAWSAVNPAGANGQSASAFHRDDAFLTLLFLADDEECSIAPKYASPSFTCQTDDDCPDGSSCTVNAAYAEHGFAKKLCHGNIKTDYYGVCGMLEEFVSPEESACQLDLDCQDCETDADCPDLWFCKNDRKCRPPDEGALIAAASFASPPGSPLFSVWPVEEFLANLKSLKAAPRQVLVATIVGDGLTTLDGSQTCVEEACIEADFLDRCQALANLAGEAPAHCQVSPYDADCTDYLQARLDCLRQCHRARGLGLIDDGGAFFSFACNGASGRAAVGHRYIRLVDMLGEQAVHTSYCHPSGIPYALQRTGDLIIDNVNRALAGE